MGIDEGGNITGLPYMRKLTLRNASDSLMVMQLIHSQDNNIDFLNLSSSFITHFQIEPLFNKD